MATEFLYRQWKAGRGYYGAWDHKTPMSWEDFKDRPSVREQGKTIRTSRYICYLFSWAMKNGQDPDVQCLSTNPVTAAKILKRYQKKAMARTAELVEENAQKRK